MCHKTAETTQNISTAFGPELLMNMVQCWFKKALQGRQKPWRWGCSGWPSEVDRNHRKLWISLVNHYIRSSTTWEVDEEINLNCSMHIQHFEANWKGERLSKCASKLTLNQKNHHLKCCLYSGNSKEPFLDELHAMKVNFIWQLEYFYSRSSMITWRRNLQQFPVKPKLH